MKKLFYLFLIASLCQQMNAKIVNDDCRSPDKACPEGKKCIKTKETPSDWGPAIEDWECVSLTE